LNLGHHQRRVPPLAYKLQPFFRITVFSASFPGSGRPPASSVRFALQFPLPPGKKPPALDTAAALPSEPDTKTKGLPESPILMESFN
jgi:hypothetical protein